MSHLLELGLAPHRGAREGQGNRETSEYLLNREQINFILTRCGLPNADAACIHVARVFSAWEVGRVKAVDFAENLIPSNLKELQPSDKTGPKPTSHRCTLRMAWGEDRISQVARAKGEGPWVFRSY